MIITGAEQKTVILCESVYKQDGDLLVNKLNGNVLPESITSEKIPPGPVVSIESLFPTGKQVGGVELIQISSTKNRFLNQSGRDEIIPIQKDKFIQMVNKKEVTAKGPNSMEMKGDPLSRILNRLQKET